MEQIKSVQEEVQIPIEFEPQNLRRFKEFAQEKENQLAGRWVLHTTLSRSWKKFLLKFECIDIPINRQNFDRDVKKLEDLVWLASARQDVKLQKTSRNALFWVPSCYSLVNAYCAFDQLHCSPAQDQVEIGLTLEDLYKLKKFVLQTSSLHGEWTLETIHSEDWNQYQLDFNCIGIPTNQKKFDTDIKTLESLVKLASNQKLTRSLANRSAKFLPPNLKAFSFCYCGFNLLHCNKEH